MDPLDLHDGETEDEADRWTVEVPEELLEQALALLAGISREALETYARL